MRVVHYSNQFFGGIGGEDQAGSPPQVIQGAVGPGRLLDSILPEGSGIDASLICGDDYAAEHLEEVADWAVAKVQEIGADLLVAGPCFQAGRYGTAAGAVCAAVQEKLAIAAITGMDLENPGVDIYRSRLHIVDSGRSPAEMREVIAKMASIGLKLVNKQPLGRPADEGYIPQGFMRSEYVQQTAAQRLGSMLLAKLKGQPFESEVPIEDHEPVAAPAPVTDLSKASIALVTDGGLVPKGNPDKFPRAFARVWGAYSIGESGGLQSAEFEVAHGGYDVRHVEEDPDRLVPVGVLREMEFNGVIGKLHGEFLSTTGNANPLENSRRIGREMALRLKEAEVDAVILTST